MGIAVGKDPRGLTYIGHGGSIAGFTSHATWYPDAQAAIVVLMNSNGNIDPGAVAGELAGELLPWKLPEVKQFSGDAAPLLGTYKGPSRGQEMVMEVTQGAQGIEVSVNGSPRRSPAWVEGLTFRQGNSLLIFRQTGNSGPATELRFDGGPGSYFILKRQ
jgi:hypothetical protein